ncbi:hypothetical protein [Marinifilum fragile]|uniref:hypothetical protein n=1 Tax=Marinifilum fragile TaxID=570161 RepID=UPI002AAB62F7|nr:hypothetical protein [Marinifilum fragile]
MATRYFYLILFILLTGVACSDFTEEDIEGDIVMLLGPADGSITETQSLTFWWEYLDGATKYRLQIVRPSFDGAISLELDTLITENRFLFSLYPGDFQWRVRAENEAYVSAYTTYSITIEEPKNISEQKIVLISPKDNLAVNNGKVSFSWNELTIADNYTFEIYKESWQGTPAMDAEDITANDIMLDITDGKYAWGVKANDLDKKESTPYAHRIIYVDTKNPNVPELSSPDDKSNSTSKDQTFKWNFTEDDEVTLVSYQIQISEKNDFSTILHESKADDKQYAYTFENTGTYYWRVKARDKAGNESSYSQTYTLRIDQ